MTKKEIIATLEAAGIAHDPKALKADLEKLLPAAAVPETEIKAPKKAKGNVPHEGGAERHGKRQEEVDREATADANVVAAQQARDKAAKAEAKAAKKAAEAAAKADRERRARKTVHNDPIEISMVITTADGEKHEDQITIANPCGCMDKHQVTNPNFIVSSVKAELADRFGANHVR